MKYMQKIKKCVAIALAWVIVFLTTNSLHVHAQDISQVSAYKPGYGIATTSDGSGVNVRSEPNLTTSSIIRSIPDGTRVMIVGESGDFYKVQYDTDGHYGYMIKRLVVFFPQDYYLQADTTNGDPLNMYEEFDTNSKIIATIPNKTYFAYWLDLGDWYAGIYGIALGHTLAEDTKLCTY